MADDLALRHRADENILRETRLIALVLDGVTSDHPRRSYRIGLVAFLPESRFLGLLPSSMRSSSSIGCSWHVGLYLESDVGLEIAVRDHGRACHSVTS